MSTNAGSLYSSISTSTSSTSDDFRYITHSVTPLDNLMSLAVKYRTTIPAIKRINQGLLLPYHIPPTIKELKIPVRGEIDSALTNPGGGSGAAGAAERKTDSVDTADGSKNKEIDAVEELKQAEANDEYFKRKSFVVKMACTEEEAAYYLEATDYEVQKAYKMFTEDFRHAALLKFIEKVQGDCTVEEATQMLVKNGWNVDKAVRLFNKHNKGQSILLQY